MNLQTTTQQFFTLKMDDYIKNILKHNIQINKYLTNKQQDGMINSQFQQLLLAKKQLENELNNKQLYIDVQQQDAKIHQLDYDFINNYILFRNKSQPEILISENLFDAINYEFNKLQQYIQLANDMNLFKRRDLQTNINDIETIAKSMQEKTFTQNNIDYNDKQQQTILECSFQLALIMKEQFKNPLQISYEAGLIHMKYQQQNQQQDDDLDDFQILFSKEALEEDKQLKFIQSQYHQTFATQAKQAKPELIRINACTDFKHQYYHLYFDDRYEGCPNACPKSQFVGNLKIWNQPQIIKLQDE